jgi:hypothetical protein
MRPEHSLKERGRQLIVLLVRGVGVQRDRGVSHFREELAKLLLTIGDTGPFALAQSTAVEATDAPANEGVRYVAALD